VKPQGVGILKIRELGGDNNKAISKVALSFTLIPSAFTKLHKFGDLLKIAMEVSKSSPSQSQN
jgi:hypothetical protein